MRESRLSRAGVEACWNATFCKGLVERSVSSAADVFRLMQKAQHQRIVGETKMNKASSRSHCLFTMKVLGKIDLAMRGDYRGTSTSSSSSDTAS